MGQAFHRKQISISRTKTRGIGVQYFDVFRPVARELTAAEVAAREAKQQQQRAAEAAAEEQRRVRRKHIDAFVSGVEPMLRLWKEAVDYNDRRAVEFAGWTTSNVCALPVDEQVGIAYAQELVRYTRRFGRPLSLDEMDAVVDQGFRNERIVPTEQVVDRAIYQVRYAAEKSHEDDGNVSIKRFVRVLAGCKAKASQDNIDLDSALAYVSKQVALRFQQQS